MSKQNRHSHFKPFLDKDAKTAQGKVANYICDKCLGNVCACSSCTLRLFVNVLKLHLDGKPLDAAYKKARDQDYLKNVSGQEYILKKRMIVGNGWVLKIIMVMEILQSKINAIKHIGLHLYYLVVF